LNLFDNEKVLAILGAGLQELDVVVASPSTILVGGINTVADDIEAAIQAFYATNRGTAYFPRGYFNGTPDIMEYVS